MEFEKNPFEILKISSQTIKTDIEAAATARCREFPMNKDMIMEAKDVLLDPERRLNAELRWFCGEDALLEQSLRLAIEKQSVSQVGRMIQKGLPPLVSLMASIYILPFSRVDGRVPLSEMIRKIDSLYSTMSMDTLREVIRATRQAAAIEEMPSEEELVVAWHSLHGEIVDAVSQAMNDSLNDVLYRRIMNEILEAPIAESEGKIIAALVPKYNEKMEGQLYAISSHINEALGKLSDGTIGDDWEGFYQELEAHVIQGATIYRPIVLWALKNEGRSPQIPILNALLEAYNNQQDIYIVLELLSLITNAFSFVPEIAEQGPALIQYYEELRDSGVTRIVAEGSSQQSATGTASTQSYETSQHDNGAAQQGSQRSFSMGESNGGGSINRDVVHRVSQDIVRNINTYAPAQTREEGSKMGQIIKWAIIVFIVLFIIAKFSGFIFTIIKIAIGIAILVGIIKLIR